MKKNNIKVGEEYAHSNRTNYGRYAQRVRVSEHVKTPARRSSSSVSGVRVVSLNRETGDPVMVNGEIYEFVISNREVKEVWASYAERVAAERLWHERRVREAEEQAERDAKINAAILDALIAKGVVFTPWTGIGSGDGRFDCGSTTSLTLTREQLLAVTGVDAEEVLA